MLEEVNRILPSFGIDPSQYSIERVSTGHINYTFKVSGAKSFILQRVNKNIFKQPQVIADNLRIAGDYLKKNHPDYLFLNTIPTISGDGMAYDAAGYPWRLFPAIENTFTIDKVETQEEAYSAAFEFAKLTNYLSGCDVHQFQETIPQFHDLSLRFQQFENALKNASQERKLSATGEISFCLTQVSLVKQYSELISSQSLTLRVMHNDTKINNILFSKKDRKAACVIDLDTLMPGYFIYDLGDMIRTFVSPVSEEEGDLTKIAVREGFMKACIEGYLAQMKDVLTISELRSLPLAGPMMTFIMALRFLTDHLNGNIYYNTTYSDQNLVRARNQLELYKQLIRE